MEDIFCYQSHRSPKAHAYSTKIDNTLSRVTSQRSFHQYRHSHLEQSQRKFFNMNDSQRRIRREYTNLYQKSTQESCLFEKGRKKVELKLATQSGEAQTRSISRGYRNRETYDVLKPEPLNLKKMTAGGVRRINLYDHNQNQESKTSREFSHSFRKSVDSKNPNDESKKGDGCGVYVVKKLPTHNSNQPCWMNQETHLHFGRKQNKLNKQNLSHNLVSEGEGGEKKKCRKILLHKKGNVVNSEAGITLAPRPGKAIDFRENYYKKERKIIAVQNNGFLSERCR